MYSESQTVNDVDTHESKVCIALTRFSVGKRQYMYTLLVRTDYMFSSSRSQIKCPQFANTVAHN